MDSVITIGRQYGSGGRQVGRMLAEIWGVPYYDKELLTLAAKDSGICEDLFESYDEKPTKSLLFSLVMGMQFREKSGEYYLDMPLNHKIFLAQFDTIRRLASQGPCVIVGRCADYVLKDRPDAVSVFVYAPLEARVKRAIDQYGLPEETAQDAIVKTDKQRASYYNYYTSSRWGQAENYHLCLDSSLVGVEGAVQMIREYVELAEAVRKNPK